MIILVIGILKSALRIIPYKGLNLPNSTKRGNGSLGGTTGMTAFRTA